MGFISGVLVPFGGLLRAPKPFLGQILTFRDPPCKPGQNFVDRNGFYRCPIHSTAYFIFNSNLLGAFKAL